MNKLALLSRYWAVGARPIRIALDHWFSKSARPFSKSETMVPETCARLPELLRG